MLPIIAHAASISSETARALASQANAPRYTYKHNKLWHTNQDNHIRAYPRYISLHNLPGLLPEWLVSELGLKNLVTA